MRLLPLLLTVITYVILYSRTISWKGGWGWGLPGMGCRCHACCWNTPEGLKVSIDLDWFSYWIVKLLYLRNIASSFLHSLRFNSIPWDWFRCVSLWIPMVSGSRLSFSLAFSQLHYISYDWKFWKKILPFDLIFVSQFEHRQFQQAHLI